MPVLLIILWSIWIVSFRHHRGKNMQLNRDTPTLKPEMKMQMAVCQFIRNYTDLPFIHIPNEGLRSKITGALLKRMGLCPGASDIFIPRAKNDFHGLFMELKYGENKLTPAQIKFIQMVEKEGYKSMVCWSAVDAINKILEFYGLVKEGVMHGRTQRIV